jgi:hypothetical protein
LSSTLALTNLQQDAFHGRGAYAGVSSGFARHLVLQQLKQNVKGKKAMAQQQSVKGLAKRFAKQRLDAAVW